MNQGPTYQKGQLVRNASLGLGKVLDVRGDVVTVFFKEQNENPRKVKVSVVPLQIAELQSDPWLDHLDVAVWAKSPETTYLTHPQAVAKFLHRFPQGFYDPGYCSDERTYKWEAHQLWDQMLSRNIFRQLLSEGAEKELLKRVMQVESKTNLLAVFEKAALREATREEDCRKRFVKALADLIYGDSDFEGRFSRFSIMLRGLPQPKTPLKWTVITLFPFLALPNEHLFLKPDVTKEAAQRRGFALNYRSELNWSTYSSLKRFGELLMNDLADLKPRDMIDIQSFIWVTGEDHY